MPVNTISLSEFSCKLSRIDSVAFSFIQWKSTQNLEVCSVCVFFRWLSLLSVPLVTHEVLMNTGKCSLDLFFFLPQPIIEGQLEFVPRPWTVMGI